jgi:hypothetical protein
VIATGLLTENEYLMNEEWRYVIEPKLPKSGLYARDCAW